MERQQYVIVKLDDEIYGIDIQKVQVIERLSRITRVPQASSEIRGVINLRGDIIPVMSIKERLEMQEDTYTDESRVIILNTKKGSMGIIVDAVREVLDIDTEDMDNVRELSNNINSQYIYALGKVKDQIVVILNIEGIMEDVA